MANVGPSAWYCRDNSPTSTIGWSAVTAWTNHTTTAGELRRQNITPTVGNERVFAALNAAATGGSEPTWIVTKGAKTTDGSVTWIEVTGQPGVNGDIPISKTTNALSATSSTILFFASTTGIQPGMMVNHASTQTGANNPVVLTVSSTTVSISNTLPLSIASGQTVWFGYCPTSLVERSQILTLGLVIYDTVSASLQVVSIAGTAGSGAPSFSATAGTTTSDNTVTWTSLGLASNFGYWAAPAQRMANAAASTWMTAGNFLFVADDHSLSTAATQTITFPGTIANPNYIVSVDHTAALPPNSAARKVGATEVTTGTSVLSVNGTGFTIDGFTFTSGSGSNSVGASYGNSNAARPEFRNCLLGLGGTTGGTLTITGTNGLTRLVNTPLKFASASSTVTVTSELEWEDTLNAVQGTGPTNLFSAANASVFGRIRGVDLSGATNNFMAASAVVNGNWVLEGCTVKSGFTFPTPGIPSHVYYLITSDSSATSYRSQSSLYTGAQIPETTIVRTGGASDGTTPLSWNITTTANSSWLLPFESFQCAEWNVTIGSSVTVTIYGVTNAALMSNNDDAWIDVVRMGSTLTPIVSFSTSTKASVLATSTALTADTSAWDSLVTARANTTAYSLGNTIKLASNPGRVFFCTTPGTSAGSEPVGYASAIDGGSVTDNTAIFRAAWRWKISVAVTPQMIGYIFVIIKQAKSSTTIYYDPKPVFS